MTESHLAFAQRIRIRLFLEGIELPVISASTTAAANSPAACSIQMPPLVEGTRLLPRTLVHIFFLDAYEASNPFVLDSGVAGKVASTDQTNPTDDVEKTEATANSEAGEKSPENITTIKAAPCGDISPKEWSNRRYKLFFGGEVVGFTWTKTPMNRSLVLQCEDWSNYWDYAYQWSNTGIFGPGQKAIFSGGATNLFTDFLTSKGSMLTAILLKGKCNTFPKLQGLAAGVVRLIEAIGGSYYVPTGVKGLKKFAGQNVFFSISELRLHITQMITAFETDPTSKKLLSRQGYGGMFNRTLGGLGEQVSIRKAITAITKVMFHETYPQPCPYYKPGTGTDPQGTRRVRISQDKRWSFFARQSAVIAKNLDSIRTSVGEMKSQPVLAQRSFSKSVRASMKGYKDKIDGQLTLLRQSLPTLKQRSAPDMLVSIYTLAIKALKDASRATSNWRPGGKDYWTKLFESKLDEAITQLRRVPNLTVALGNLKERTPARLVQQILRPDIWFGSPPRCNVLFPEMYEQISYQRMFLQEPTRFLLKTNNEFFGEDFLFDKFYFAPQAGSLKKDQAQLRDVLRNDILDHELFTGILPVYEKMGEFNVFAARSNRELQGKVVKVSYAQRSANFLYFKHRFNARQFQLSGRFNPYVAVGFPGLIIDKWLDRGVAERIRNIREEFLSENPEASNALLPKYSAELIGANFLANFAEVTHQVSQEQLRGHTMIRCTYARLADEDTEFLNIGSKVQQVQKRQEGEAVRTTNVAALFAPELYSLGPNQGRIVSALDVTDKFVSTAGRTTATTADILTAGQELPVYFGGARRAGGNKLQDFFAPVGRVVTPLNDFPTNQVKAITEFFGIQADTELFFRAYAVKEEVPRYKLEEVDIPAEELIRPGWYGDIWSPGKIGEVYRDFLGIGSITEPTTILDGKGNVAGQASENFKRAVEEAQTSEDVDWAVDDLPIVVSLGEGSTIGQAAEFLNLTYSYVKQADLDADEFIRAYTWRPIATLIDMFGTEDLEFTEDGSSVANEGAIEGFHSRAFGPYEDVFGLVTPEIETVLGIKRGSTTAQRADTRKRKLERVLKFSTALTGGRAQVG